MKAVLTRVAVKSVFLALLLSLLLGTVSQGSANACEICVQLETAGEIWYGCASEYGNLGTEWCVPLGDHCDAGGAECDPTPGNCQQYPCQLGCPNCPYN